MTCETNKRANKQTHFIILFFLYMRFYMSFWYTSPTSWYWKQALFLCWLREPFTSEFKVDDEEFNKLWMKYWCVYSHIHMIWGSFVSGMLKFLLLPLMTLRHMKYSNPLIKLSLHCILNQLIKREQNVFAIKSSFKTFSNFTHVHQF
jgi:hypothetical protein